MILPVLLSLLAGSALFGLGYIEGIRRGRGERKLELAVDVARTPGAFAVPEVRPQFCAPVIDVEAMQRVEAAVMPRLKKINCSTRGDA